MKPYRPWSFWILVFVHIACDGEAQLGGLLATTPWTRSFYKDVGKQLELPGSTSTKACPFSQNFVSPPPVPLSLLFFVSGTNNALVSLWFHLSLLYQEGQGAVERDQSKGPEKDHQKVQSAHLRSFGFLRFFLRVVRFCFGDLDLVSWWVWLVLAK